MFNFRSSLLQLTELKIWAKTKALKTSVWTVRSCFLLLVVSWKPRILEPRKWKMSVTVIWYSDWNMICLYISTENSGAVFLSGLRSSNASVGRSAAATGTAVRSGR